MRDDRFIILTKSINKLLCSRCEIRNVLQEKLTRRMHPHTSTSQWHFGWAIVMRALTTWSMLEVFEGLPIDMTSIRAAVALFPFGRSLASRILVGRHTRILSSPTRTTCPLCVVDNIPPTPPRAVSQRLRSTGSRLWWVLSIDWTETRPISSNHCRL